MIKAEISVNGKPIAEIMAINVGVVSDRPGDFIGDRATVSRYQCEVFNSEDGSFVEIDVEHDRRLGWQGLISAITKKATPLVVDTVTVDRDEVCLEAIGQCINTAEGEGYEAEAAVAHKEICEIQKWLAAHNIKWHWGDE